MLVFLVFSVVVKKNSFKIIVNMFTKDTLIWGPGRTKMVVQTWCLLLPTTTLKLKLKYQKTNI